MHRTVIGSCYAGDCGTFQGKVWSLIPCVNKAVLHQCGPFNGESGRFPFDTILGIGDDFKFTGVLRPIPVKASQVKGCIGGSTYEFPASILVRTENPVHKCIVRLVPIYPCLHNLVRRINHLVQRHIGNSPRSALIRSKSHLPYVDSIIRHSVRSLKPQGNRDGRLARILPEPIDRGCGPASACIHIQRIELKILFVISIPEAQTQGDIHPLLRCLINHIKFACRCKRKLRAVQLHMVRFPRIHGAIEFQGRSRIPGVIQINLGRKLLAVGINEPPPGRQHIRQGTVIPSVFLAHHYAVLIELITVSGGKIRHKVRADHRRTVSHQIGKAAEFILRTIVRRRVIGRSYPQPLILIIQEVIRTDGGSQGTCGRQDTQAALQNAVCVKPRLVSTALGIPGHGPVFPGGMDIPGIHAALSGCLDRAVYIAAASHIQPPLVGNPGIPVLHPAIDLSGTQSSRTIVPGYGKIIRLVFLQVNQELLKTRNACSGFRIEDIAVKSIVLRNLYQLIRRRIAAVCFFLYHFTDKLVPVGVVPPWQKDCSGSRHTIAVSRINDLRGRNRDRAFTGRTPPEIIGVYILEIVKCIYEISVSALGWRLTRSGIGHCKGIHLCVPGRQRIDVRTHPTLPQRN